EADPVWGRRHAEGFLLRGRRGLRGHCCTPALGVQGLQRRLGRAPDGPRAHRRDGRGRWPADRAETCARARWRRACLRFGHPEDSEGMFLATERRFSRGPPTDVGMDSILAGALIHESLDDVGEGLFSAGAGESFLDATSGVAPEA